MCLLRDLHEPLARRERYSFEVGNSRRKVERRESLISALAGFVLSIAEFRYP